MGDLFLSICAHGDARAVRLKLPYVKDKDKQEGLEWASRYGRIAVVRLILRWNLDITSAYTRYESIIPASINGKTATVKLLLYCSPSAHAKQEALHSASEHGHIQIVRLLLAYGTDTETPGNKAVRVASIHKHLDVAKLLLAYGAHIYGRGTLLGWLRHNNLAIYNLILAHDN